MLLVPLFDYLLAAVQRVVSGANKSGKCVNYFANDDGFKWVNDLSQLATGIVCNIFMLRNMSIASMISSEWISEEEEREKRRRLQLITYLFLACYITLYLSLFAVQFKLYNSPNNNVALGFFLTLNLLKLIMCTSLGVTTIILSQKLKELHKQMKQEYGNTTPQVKRLAFLRMMLVLMACIYMSTDWIYNLVLPSTILSLRQTKNHENASLQITLQLLSDIRLQLLLIFCLLVLVYYHRLSETPEELKEQQHFEIQFPDVQAPLTETERHTSGNLKADSLFDSDQDQLFFNRQSTQGEALFTPVVISETQLFLDQQEQYCRESQKGVKLEQLIAGVTQKSDEVALLQQMDVLRSMAGKRKGELALHSMVGRSFTKSKYDRLEYLMASEYSVRDSGVLNTSRPPDLSKANQSPQFSTLGVQPSERRSGQLDTSGSQINNLRSGSQSRNDRESVNKSHNDSSD